MDYASWVVSQFAYARPRIASVTIDLHVLHCWHLHVGVCAGYRLRIKVTGLPTTGVSTVFEGFIEGFTEVYSANEVSLTLDTSAVAPRRDRSWTTQNWDGSRRTGNDCRNQRGVHVARGQR